MRDAYKNVPCSLHDLRLQGFKWLEKCFYETAQMFGAKSAVPNYDILGHTVASLTICICNIPPELVHRHLNDVPTVQLGQQNQNFVNCFQKFIKQFAKT